ncbi:hypothetical protein BOX15_Mlig014526g1, partial [Macrostomum lignano]
NMFSSMMPLLPAFTRCYASSATAFDYALKIRTEMINNSEKMAKSESSAQVKQGDKMPINNPIDKEDGSVLPNKRTWSFASLKPDEIVEFLYKNIVWDKYGIVAINKPYNVCCQGGTVARGSVNLIDHLPGLAARLSCPHLHPVHRIDRTSTGIVLLARTEQQARHLKLCFKERRIEKYYYCITRDVPSPLEGIVDIPLTASAKHRDCDWRAALRPTQSALDEANLTVLTRARVPTASSRSGAKEAVTRYRVVDKFERCALVEVQPLTGCKHQIRVHLGYGLNTPVLGDHKYSSMRDRLMPQRLPESTLTRLGIRPARARDLPLFLHCQRVAVPVDPSKSPSDSASVSVIKAPFPYQFVRVMRQLKLRLPIKLIRSKFI